MADSYTFSQLVLDLKRVSGLHASMPSIINRVRSVMKTCHSLGYFTNDLVEDEIICLNVTDSVYKQPIDQFRHRKIYSICQSIRNMRGERTPFVEVSPAELNERIRPSHSCYISGGQLIIAPVTENERLYYGELTYPLIFAFYEQEADRPARFDIETQSWIYRVDYNTPELKTTARGLVTNWMLQGHYDVVKDGVLAVLWKEVDDPRAGAAYSRYMAGKKEILNTNTVLVMPVLGGKYGNR